MVRARERRWTTPTCPCLLAVCEEKFVTKHVATIGIDFGVKPVTIKGEAVRVNFFYMAGGDQYRDIRVEFYKDCQGVVLVFDLNNKATFDALENWLVEAEANGLNNPMMVRISTVTFRSAPMREAFSWW